MSADLYASVNGERLTDVRLTVSNVGPWIADVDFEGDPDVRGLVTLKIDTLKLVGSIAAVQSGKFGMRQRARIIAGGGSWSVEVPAKHYHNDAGVKARLVVEDAARLVGETLGNFVPAAERVGRDYARQAGPASRALETVIGGVPWWVDYDGVTHAGPRPTVALADSQYTVLAYDPRDRIATLAVDDPGAVRVGSVISTGLDGPHVIRSFELRLSANELRVLAWCGGADSGYGHITGLLRSIVQRATDSKLHGHYRYRVVRMAGDRVELQAVRKSVGLPDLLPISFMPGVSGTHAELAPGAEVLVVFVEGDRAQPVAVAFAGKDGNGFVPVQLTLGGPSGSPAARQGDIVECTLPPASFSGTVNGQPAIGLLTFTPAKALGIITNGSSKVRIAT